MNELKKKIKQLIKVSTSIDQIKQEILKEYEQISSKQEKKYSDKYDIYTIMRTCDFDKVCTTKKDNHVIIVEKIDYEQAPKKYILVFNIYQPKKALPDEIIMYV